MKIHIYFNKLWTESYESQILSLKSKEDVYQIGDFLVIDTEEDERYFFPKEVIKRVIING